ncbi:hypothetical protein [Thermus amyloliquefaciens]|uniref:hypothetical protein n=1 Tax=Thermus amyloliquefaciens TaxID=1449080 RepID=UPI00056DF1D9|nr:hypothetical protein [Thermus amyloliquefaciens]
MVDSWTHAANLDKAVEQGGVAQARVAQEDYEGVKPLMRLVWQGKRWENLLETVRSRGKELVPARVLLGYLRGYFLYREVPENDQTFWRNFLRDLGVENTHPTQAEYNRLWEVLRWHEETARCLKFHENGDRDFIGTLDAIFHFKALRLAVLKEYFLHYYRTGELPARAQAYEQVFRRLEEALQLLLELEENALPDLGNEQAVLDLFQEAGLYLGEPNPVRLLFNRSDQALKDLYWKLRDDKPPIERAHKRTHLRHKQVKKVEPLEFPPSLEKIQPALNQEPLVEGWKVYGKVTLEDGRFKRFAWVPRFTPEGDPIPEEVVVAFEDGEVVRFRLHHQAFAVRFSEPVWKPGEPLEVRPIGFDPAHHPLRFLLASGGEAKENLEELVQAMDEEAGQEEQLVVEVRTNGKTDEWRRIAVLPVEVRPRLDAWVDLQGAFVRTHPPGCAVRVQVFAGERLVQEKILKPEVQGTLAVRAALVPLQVHVQLGSEARSFTVAPKGWPQHWWRLGLGLGIIANANRNAQTG